MNPGWAVRYYTDADCLAWITLHCPELVDAYQSLPAGIHRANLFRILVLYYEGGVYADIDIECIRPLDELLARLAPSKSLHLTRDHPVHENLRSNRRPTYTNDFMIATPGDAVLEEVLKWMLACPPATNCVAEAVVNTGAEVISSVIEMLGGATMLPDLQVTPTPWVHPLPDMNCQFDEKAYYQTSIASRDWLQRDVYLVHYWFHTWVDGPPKNTLTKNADVLLSTLGEQVERKLQWLLGDSATGSDEVIASALAELAEMHGTVILYVDRPEDPFMDRVLDLLAQTGLKPKLLIISPGDIENLESRVDALKQRGAAVVRPALLGQAAANGCTPKVLLVAAPTANLNHHGLQQYVKQSGGLLLGPTVDWARQIFAENDVALSELASADHLVPRVMHLLPGHSIAVPELADRLADYELSIRQWTDAEVRALLEDMFLGVWDWSLVPTKEAQFLTALAILYLHGGAVFHGDQVMLPEQLHRNCRTTFCLGKSGWLLACPPRHSLVAGAIQQWRAASHRGGAGCDVRSFLEERVSSLSRLGHLRDLHTSRAKAHPFLP